MTVRAYLIVMTCVSIVAWVTWVVVLHAIDPTKTEFFGFFIFYVTLGLALLSSLTFIGTLVRIWFKKNEIIFKQVIRSLRQAILLTVLFLASLALLSTGLFVWWTMILLLVIVVFIEGIFISIGSAS